MLQTDLSSFSYKKGSILPSCKRCGEQNFYRNGKNKKGFQRYRCRKCNFRFVWTSDLPNRRCFSHIVSFAVKLYTDLRKGISLRGVAEVLKEVFDTVVSHETVRKWIKTSKKSVSRRKIIEATDWHADETYIKIKGLGFWLWIAYDYGGVLSWHISKKRLHKDAMLLMKKALDVAGTRPAKITTDGLYQYQSAIKKVMGWKWNVYRKNHVIDSGIGKNAIIERLNREIKRRLKWFSTFQSFEGAVTFFSLWFYHYNQRKSSHIT